MKHRSATVPGRRDSACERLPRRFPWLAGRAARRGRNAPSRWRRRESRRGRRRRWHGRSTSEGRRCCGNGCAGSRSAAWREVRNFPGGVAGEDPSEPPREGSSVARSERRPACGWVRVLDRRKSDGSSMESGGLDDEASTAFSRRDELVTASARASSSSLELQLGQRGRRGRRRAGKTRTIFEFQRDEAGVSSSSAGMCRSSGPGIAAGRSGARPLTDHLGIGRHRRSPFCCTDLERSRGHHGGRPRITGSAGAHAPRAVVSTGVERHHGRKAEFSRRSANFWASVRVASLEFSGSA